ncbi:MULTISPECIES: signal peptidase I [unclassified Undibacterium]|uniref:signal peptidase I n=1 Tax=unclassified Undibacterium TaxID=2630295 RepID=UPI002AC8FABB|nr:MULTISPECIES: signal peptidase I [unclassified Undibacterium]MEB0139092.1 signal peptidase I [Undibacterium sp. CCC2.1]MEB0172951.1 signal peptidase I [Undibacterium sp. CCC1.1]MEB0177273.1 signal peptidase I [Undibacterium sp. CCC3.4]MEB0215869.1 signal peptidase I [Undibacterium sp. 5I2]WPX42072.1 signal peptidase I [Undibacterium sp. CCC3.4]
MSAAFKMKKLFAQNKGFLAFVLGMVLVRSALADFYVVPSSSMYPTLLEGDRVICDRLAYDVKLPLSDIVLTHLADPQRGDVVTFSSPEDGTRLVKRLVALPGDVVEMREEKLSINGEVAHYQSVATPARDHLTPQHEYAGEQLVWQESLGSMQHRIIVMPERPALRSFGPLTVPPGQYLMLGDNRDNSKDSRYIGLVKRELITGQVKRLMFSLDGQRYYLPRLERFGAAI